MSLADDIATVDDLPPVPRPALTFATVALVAEEAALAGLDMAADGKHDRAVGAIEDHIRDMRPAEGLSTVDAWARRGAVSGVVAAWGTRIGVWPVYSGAASAPSTSHAAAHFSSWQLAAVVVMGVRCG